MPDAVTDFLVRFAWAAWDIWAEAAPWVLVGFLAAALLKALVPDRVLARHLGGSGMAPVLKASLLGAPLPLCSCGVLPAAAGLRRQGAGRGATAAFLVSTPETGVDSVAVTWALLDPLMTVVRPLAALVTATVAGWLVDLTPEPAPEPVTGPPAANTLQPLHHADQGAPAETGCGCSGCGCSNSANDETAPLSARLGHGLRSIWDEMLGDIGPWLVGGILAAAALSALLPEGVLADLPGGEWSQLGAMLAVGAPLYVCATASTPVAAALALKGLSPGAALVLLLAGPATNAATIAVTARMLGRRAAVAVLAAVAVCSLSLGWALNRLYPWLGLDTASWTRPLGEGGHGALAAASAVVLGLALAVRLTARFRPRAS